MIHLFGEIVLGSCIIKKKIIIIANIISNGLHLILLLEKNEFSIFIFLNYYFAKVYYLFKIDQ